MSREVLDLATCELKRPPRIAALTTEELDDADRSLESDPAHNCQKGDIDAVNRCEKDPGGHEALASRLVLDHFV